MHSSSRAYACIRLRPVAPTLTLIDPQIHEIFCCVVRWNRYVWKIARNLVAGNQLDFQARLEANWPDWSLLRAQIYC